MWQAFRGISSEEKDVIFSAKVMCASSKRKEVNVLLPPRNTFEDPKPSFMLVGNPFQRACTVIKGNSIVAQVIIVKLSISVMINTCCLVY